MRFRLRFLLFLPLLIVATACGDRSAPRFSSDEVAAAGNLRLTVEEAANILALDETLPNDSDLVRALADFWIDYTLLALAVNSETGLDGIDISPLLEQQEKQLLIMALRDAVIPDVVDIPEDELEMIYREERAGEVVRARHILLLFPADATRAQQDSVQALAEELRDRARAGADFGALAAQWSEDPGSAERGGDLDYFPRDFMVPQFEEAAFSLEPGEISDVVQTEYGLHVIRVEDRQWPALDEIRDDLIQSLLEERTNRAESTYVADAEASGDVRIEEDAAEIIREVASGIDEPLPARAARRVIARYAGGSFTAEDFRTFLIYQAQGMAPQIEFASDDELGELVVALMRTEVLVADARARGLVADPDMLDDVAEEIRGQYEQLATMVGVDGVTPEEGERMEDAVRRTTVEIMHRVVRGDVDVFPMQVLAIPLRDAYGAGISDDGVARVVERVEAVRTGHEDDTEPDDAPSDADEAPDPGEEPTP